VVGGSVGIRRVQSITFQCRLEAAETLGWRLLGIWEKRRTSDHPLMAACLGNPAELRLAQKWRGWHLLLTITSGRCYR
jgi:hypothetical protein